jgi:hypothetical protein
MRRVVLFDSPSRIRACRMLSSRFVCFLLISFSVSATAQLPELKDVDLTGWDCFSKLEGGKDPGRSGTEPAEEPFSDRIDGDEHSIVRHGRVLRPCRGLRPTDRQETSPLAGAYAERSKAHKIRVTGYLMWDDEHNRPDTDVGSTIGWFSKEGYHHPWRSTGWEIHPVMKIEDLGTE